VRFRAPLHLHTSTDKTTFDVVVKSVSKTDVGMFLIENRELIVCIGSSALTALKTRFPTLALKLKSRFL
jgi:hypothetical protein